MKLLIAAALLAAPAFADCCSYRHVMAEASRARAEVRRQARRSAMELRHMRTEVLREAARARMEARRAMRDAYRSRDRHWFF
jgi:hypothetical protein